MGAKANYQDQLNQTPLFYACRDGRLEIAKLLIQHGCDVNHLDTYGQTPFFYAVSQSKLELIEHLVQQGADHDKVDNNLQTPAFYAIKENQEENLKYLLQKGINIGQKDKKGVSLMMQAKKNTKNPQYMAILEKAGAEPLPQIEPKRNMKVKKNQAVKKPSAAQALLNTHPVDAKAKRAYVLTIFKDGQWEKVSPEEFKKFCEENAEVGKYLQDQSQLSSLPVSEYPEDMPLFESWEKLASKMLYQLWKVPQSWIFQEPVDPVKLEIPDYLEIIKKPMDFDTIRKRLLQNDYGSLQEFLDDLELTFENCIQYNGNNPVGRLCLTVKEEYQKMYKQLNIPFYLGK